MTERITTEELADLIERASVDANSYARQAESSPTPHVEEEWARIARLDRDALRELSERRERERWIPVAERLPEGDTDRPVLVRFPNRSVFQWKAQAVIDIKYADMEWREVPE